MLLSNNYKDILNGKFDFYESIIDEVNIINCSDLEIKVFYFHEPFENKTLKIIFKDLEECKINNKAVIKNKNEFNIKKVHQEIDELKINDVNGLIIDIATNFEKEYIKLKCSEIWIEVID